MKAKTRITLSALLFSVLSLPAITFEELAGVYVGKRTETYPTFVMRYDEITVIESDGRVTNYLFSELLPEPFVTTGILVIDPDGNFSVGEYGQGQLSLHGRHLTSTVHFSETLFSSDDVTVHFKGHRTEKVVDLPDLPTD
jgi:hypothetical protein